MIKENLKGGGRVKMLKRLIIFNILSLFIISIVCAMAVAQEEVKKYTTIKGVVKEIDEGRGTMIIESKREEGSAKAAIRINKQTKYTVTGTHKLEPGDIVSVKCKGPEGEYEAVSVKEK